MPTELRRACNGGVDGNRTRRTSCFAVSVRAVKCAFVLFRGTFCVGSMSACVVQYRAVSNFL